MQDLGVKKVILPKIAGVLSAVGNMCADIRCDFNIVYEWNTRSPDFDGANSVLAALEKRALQFLDRSNVKDEDKILEYYLDGRYHSQSWNITFPLTMQRINTDFDVAIITETFHKFHNEMRGSKDDRQFVEVSNWRVKAIGKAEQLEFKVREKVEDSKGALEGYRNAFFKSLGGLVPTKVYNGSKLAPGMIVEPPAIIEEENSTIVVFPGGRVSVSVYGDYVVDLES